MTETHQALPGDALMEAGVPLIPVGLYLSDYLLPRLNVSPSQAAAAMDLPSDLFSDLLANRHQIDKRIAQKLYRYTGLSVGFWLNMQKASKRAAVLQAPDHG